MDTVSPRRDFDLLQMKHQSKVSETTKEVHTGPVYVEEGPRSNVFLSPEGKRSGEEYLYRGVRKVRISRKGNKRPFFHLEDTLKIGRHDNTTRGVGPDENPVSLLFSLFFYCS